MAKQQQQQQF
jgi:hypothetical protein